MIALAATVRRWSAALRLLLLVGLCATTPAGAQLVEGAVAALGDGERCDGACEDGDADCCPVACAHCSCCAHSSAVPLRDFLAAGAPGLVTVQFGFGPREGSSAGHRAPPFRPPTT